MQSAVDDDDDVEGDVEGDHDDVQCAGGRGGPA